MAKYATTLLLVLLAITALTNATASAHNPTALPDTRVTQQNDLPELPFCDTLETDESTVCQVDWAWDVQMLENDLGEMGRVWLEGNLLLFAYHAAVEDVFLDGALQTRLTPLPVKDTWGIAVRLEDVDTGRSKRRAYSI